MGEIAARLADDVDRHQRQPARRRAAGDHRRDREGDHRHGTFATIADRREAIARTIAEAGDDDVIVIAGKGHETYQVIGDQVVHFDDREEAEIALKKRNEKRA